MIRRIFGQGICLWVALCIGAASPSAQSIFVSAPLVPTTPQGRLTLTTATPVLTATVSGATTVFYTPYVGNVVPIYDGTNMVQTQCAELSNITTNSATGSAGPAVVANSSVYDLFVWSNAGVCTLTRGPLWTNTTTRSAGTALTRVNGIQLNNATITNGPAASRGTYVGTVASNGTATIDYIFGAAASGGTAASLQVWNAYNRVLTGTNVVDSGVGYTYTSATVRQARASAGNQIGFVLGLNEDTVPVAYATELSMAVAASAAGVVGLGLDSTTTFSDQRGAVQAPTVAGLHISAAVSASWSPGIGVHTLSANEASDGVNANNFDTNSTATLSATVNN